MLVNMQPFGAKLLSGALLLSVACAHAEPPRSHVGTEHADLLEGTADFDTLTGEGGDDQLLGRSGDDVLRGGRGDDELFGGAGDDRLSGGPGDDLLRGGEGDDVIEPGVGEDQMVGGPGADTFVLRIDTFGLDLPQIADFKPQEGDRIVITGVRQDNVEQLIERLSIQNGVLMLRPDIPGRGATGLVRIGDKYKLEVLTSKKSLIFSFDF